MTPDFPIIRNAPPPPSHETRGRKTKHPGAAQYLHYPFDELDVGDAFDVPITGDRYTHDGRPVEYNRLSANVSSRHRKKRDERRFCVRMMGDKVRVWRLA